MTTKLKTGADVIEAAIGGLLRFEYGSATLVNTCIYPSFEPRIERAEFIKSYVDLGQRESQRLSRMLRHAALGPQEEWTAARQRILMAFYVANLSDEQLMLIADAQTNREAA